MVLAAGPAAATDFSYGPYLGFNRHTGGTMQELYGFGWRAGWSTNWHMSGRSVITVDFDLQMAADSGILSGDKFYTVALLPSLNTIVTRQNSLSLWLGGGMGVSNRILVVTFDYNADWPPHLGAESFAFEDWSLPFLLRGDALLRLNEKTSLQFTLRYTHHYLLTSNTDQGDFGNTGGISLDIGLRFD